METKEMINMTTPQTWVLSNLKNKKSVDEPVAQTLKHKSIKENFTNLNNHVKHFDPIFIW